MLLSVGEFVVMLSCVLSCGTFIVALPLAVFLAVSFTCQQMFVVSSNVCWYPRIAVCVGVQVVPVPYLYVCWHPFASLHVMVIVVPSVLCESVV